MATSKTSRAMVLAREKEIDCLDRRARKESYRDIATALGISVGGAYTAVSRALAGLAEVCTEKAEEVRAMELMELDSMTRAFLGKALEGDGAAADRVMRFQERRSKLLGLDAPTRQHITTMTHEEAMQQLDDPDKSE